MSKRKAPEAQGIDRRPFVQALLARRGEALVVSGLGSPTWDVAAAGDSPRNLYSWGGMGLCVPTALGLALAQPSTRVLAITGDGEMMMGIGSLATAAAARPANLAVLVLDNGRFAETGGQPGLTGEGADIARIAEASGFVRTMVVERAAELPQLADLMFEAPGPVLAVARIAVTKDPWALPEKDGARIAIRFRSALGLEP